MSDLNGIKKEDPFLLQYQPSDLQIASEFLTNWLPFLSRDLCGRCTETLSGRVRSLHSALGAAERLHSDKSIDTSAPNGVGLQDKCCDDNCDKNSVGSCKDGDDTNSLGSLKDEENGWPESVAEASSSGIIGESLYTETPSHRMSWADMAQEDELVEEEEQQGSSKRVDTSSLTREIKISNDVEKPKLSRERREQIRFMNIKRKKDFICLERFKGKIVNILDGLELHTYVFSAVEQRRIVDKVYELYEMGKKGELKERTYSAPQKWMRGKGRVTLQFGCCYNYAIDKNGNPPGIVRNELVDPIPDLFKIIIKRLVRWHVLPPTCVPDSCIVNMYEEGDCIPPHIDNHDFLRPFCTVSFLSECDIVFGSNLKVVGPGEFAGPIAIPLPVGSVLVLNGNAADVARHCVPSVPTKRISITFRKMDETKQPIGFSPDQDLEGIQPFSYEVDNIKTSNFHKFEHHVKRQPVRKETRMRDLTEISVSERQYSSRSGRGSANSRRIKMDIDN
ncbi:hypothetical protein K2173_023368 [Erythroxylum novogranatense]|uniref:Fe2OG dioxygenase domain-containing protein n=1 Tax=Erythroxylum novogranatense TaxID=1862640 RepID=A0AAV8TVZ0_9ROSI|nr:hypothetical protein K2173_023368 [Erythroxylum novogranatense]